jgi:hypothetical protein
MGEELRGELARRREVGERVVVEDASLANPLVRPRDEFVDDACVDSSDGRSFFALLPRRRREPSHKRPLGGEDLGHAGRERPHRRRDEVGRDPFRRAIRRRREGLHEQVPADAS